MKTSKRLIILEGPDGAGKTQLAKALHRADPDAHYVHSGPFPEISDGGALARVYADAMRPAVEGSANVIMDRCWLSERPYGAVFRSGADRLGARTRILERLAWRCQTLVVRCLPPWEQIAENFGRRREMLDNTDQLRAVYDLYADDATWGSLPRVDMNPLDNSDDYNDGYVHQSVAIYASISHFTDCATVGNLRGRVLLVVSETTESQLMRLTEQLEADGVSEHDLYWAPADELTPAVIHLAIPIVAIGESARRRLESIGRVPNAAVSAGPYALVNALKGIL